MTGQAIILMNRATGAVQTFANYAAAADFITGMDPREWTPAAFHRG